MQQRRIVFAIFDGFQSLDLVGPPEVFPYAGTLSGGYDCQVLAPTAGLVRSTSGLPVPAGHGVADLDPRDINTLVAVGGDHVDQAAQDSALMAAGPAQEEHQFLRDGTTAWAMSRPRW
ncbi:DJ-1/PfpI family protein [Streptomyces sp. NRRL S-1448]|uniref:DJ-1/PfpI family protein n=1 Tax=Streptomyces sp. NRRL S-1448 TaxID=1463883 RepID=UPI000A44DDC8|nr:DJ-1/PfpI family protein [Streptomyces sp. NRRL S-1448]